MAIEVNVTADHMVFLGEDKQLRYAIVQADGVTPRDVSGWTLRWDLRKTDKAADPALISKTSAAGISVTGTYDADPDVNTQRVVVTLLDTDSDSSTALAAKTYRFGLKRMDAGAETMLAFGDFVFRQSTVR